MLELRSISKSFGPVTALDGVDLALTAGEVHALIGENGAGKSTLVKILAGLQQPDTGTVLVDGTPVVLTDRRSSAAHGIGVVHQHFSLVETLTVAENVQLGRPGASWRVGLDEARADLAEWSARSGLAVDADAVVGRLSIGERQRVEILTALAWGARMLLLDEPTAVLSPLEADAVLEVIRQLTETGLAVLLVTHKLREVEQVADRVTVLRGGRISGRHEGGTVTREQLAAEMIGDGRVAAPRVPAEPGEVRLTVHGLRVGRLRGVDLEVRAGEVVGIAGVAGNGQTELVSAVAGLLRPEAGEVEVDGTPIHGDPAAARRAGVAYIPEDRAADGLALELPLWLNAVAKRTGEVGTWRGVDTGLVATLTQRAIDFLGVRPGRHDARAATLSGGNQQRLVIGRELDERPAVVVAAEPTRGLDPGSALDVIDALRAVAADGAAVLVVSSDLDEVLAVAERVVVVYEGTVALEVPSEAADRTVVGRAMVGA